MTMLGRERDYADYSTCYTDTGTPSECSQSRLHYRKTQQKTNSPRADILSWQQVTTLTTLLLWCMTDQEAADCQAGHSAGWCLAHPWWLLSALP